MKSRLEVVRRWLLHKERSASRVVAAARQEADRARDQLAEVSVLKGEYQALLRQQVDAGASAGQIRSHHQFLGSLQAVENVQLARLAAESQTLEQAKSAWLRLYRDRIGMDVLVANREEGRRRRQSKQANREATDRHAFNRRFDGDDTESK